MDVAVIGAGALGTLFGGLLRRGGANVRLVHHRPEFVAEIGEEISLRFGEASTVRVPIEATTNADEIGRVDLALLLVKADQTRAAIEEHRACIGPETRVLTLQNGLRSYDILRDLVGDERALGGVTYQGSDLREPGRVVHTSAGKTIIGGTDRAFAERVATTFENAGLDPTTVVEDPRTPIWEKQLVSLAFKPTAALTRLPIGDLIEDDALLAVIEGAIEEAVVIAGELGIELSDREAVEKILEVADEHPNHRSSMLQDVTGERKTEIDAINGAIVEYADELDRSVPYNETLTALVQGLERSYLDT